MISRPNLVALIVACAFLMQTLDSTIVVTAVPKIAESFHVSAVQLSAVLTAYILSVAIFIPVSGWLADRFGARTIFQYAIVIFTLGSILCGFSHNLTELAGARFIQGMGGAAVTPVGRLAVLRTAPRSEYVRAAAFLSVPTQVGPLLGPPLGGFLATYTTWRWIFFINAPIGLIGVFLAARFIENFKEEQRRPLDWIGFALTGMALSCVMYALDAISHESMQVGDAGAVMACGLALGVLAILHARRAAHPLMDLSLLKSKSFGANFWGGTMFRIGAGSIPFLLPLLFQIVFGMTPFASGLLTFATALGSIGMRAYTPRVLRRFGYKNVLVWNEIIFAATMFTLTLFRHSTPAAVIFSVLLVSGFIQGLQLSALNSLPYSGLAPNQMSSATSLSQLAQQIAKGIGIALAAVILHVSLLLTGAKTLSTNEFTIAFVILSSVTLLSLVNFLPLPADCGADLSGHGRKAYKRS